jgi:hypothetical protein
MMKHLKGIAMTLLLTATLVACKKDSEPALFTMTGKWVGKIGQGSSEPTGYYALNIKSNGTIERISSNGEVSATGTWTLEGEVFTAIYTYPGSGGTVNVDGTVDKGKNKLVGFWENTGDEEGTFYATRNN